MMAHWKHIGPLIIGGLLVAPFGAYVVRHVPPHALSGFILRPLSGMRQDHGRQPPYFGDDQSG
jgi:hypothetical protein